MKKAMILIVIMILGFMSTNQSHAECIRKCKAIISVHYTYKFKGSETRKKESIHVERFSTEGRYGGKCTPIGIRKAKNRAMNEVAGIARNKYNGKANQQKKALCENVPNNIKQKAQWFQIDYIKVNRNVKGTREDSYKIPAATQKKFPCNGSN